MRTEETIIDLLYRDDISPKAAAFIIHAIIEMTGFEEEQKKEFKNHIIELFNSDVESGLI